MPSRVTICSGFSPHGYEQYGRRFLDTMARFLPPQIRLAVYTEVKTPMPGRIVERSLWDCRGAIGFMERHAGNPTYNGAVAIDIATRRPRGGEPEGWRWDAVKFFKQCIIPEHASVARPDGDILAWCDADVVAFAPIPPDLPERFLGDADLAYMGRQGGHSEIGFWAVRLNPRSRAFLKALAEMYVTDQIFAEAEYHSAYAFDLVRAELSPDLRIRNATPAGRSGENVWWTTPLRECLDHLKGPRRKQLGKSPERDLTRAQYDELCRRAREAQAA